MFMCGTATSFPLQQYLQGLECTCTFIAHEGQFVTRLPTYVPPLHLLGMARDHAQ